MSRHTEGFAEFYRVFVSKLDHKKNRICAYIEAERWYIAQYGENRYSSWHSFCSACYNQRKRKKEHR